MNKWLAVAILEACALLGGCVWLYHNKIEEQKAKREEQELYKPFDFRDTSSEEVYITISNHKYMEKFKDFKAAKKIQFEIAPNLGMAWIFPAKDIIRILQKCPANLETLDFACCQISSDVLKLVSAKFTKLKKLNLNYSILDEEIPDQIANLQELESLSILGSVRLKKIPKSILELKKLKELTVQSGISIPSCEPSKMPPQLRIYEEKMPILLDSDEWIDDSYKFRR